MAEILKAYNLGEKGVNVAKSPIHLEDGELVLAQNADFYAEEGRGALRKRPGMLNANDTGLGGSIAGFIGVPLPSPNRRPMLMFYENDPTLFTAQGFVTDDGGANFASSQFYGTFGTGVRHGVFEGQNDVAATGSPYALKCIVLGNFFYVPNQPNAVDTTSGRILQFYEEYDRVAGLYKLTASEVLVLPNTATVGPFFRNRGTIYAGSVGTLGASGILFELEPLTGQLTMIGQGSSFVTGTEEMFSGAANLGKLWLGTSRATQGRLHSIRRDESTWTVVRTAAANLHTYTSLQAYKGVLYCATAALSGTAALLEQMTTAGVFSTARTGGSSGQNNKWDCLFVHNGELFAFYETQDGTVCQAHKYNGSAWVNDEDLALLTGGATNVRGAVSFGRTLYVSVLIGGTVGLLKRTSTGTWTDLTVPNTGGLGHLGIF